MAAPSISSFGGKNGTTTGMTMSAGASPLPTRAAGDLLLLLVESANQAVTLDAASSANWALLMQPGVGTAAAATASRVTIFQRVATNTSDDDAVINDAGDHIAAQMIAISHPDGTPVIDVSTSNTSSATNNNGTIPAVTTTGADRLVIQGVSNVTDTTTAQTTFSAHATLSGFAEVQDWNFTSGNGGGIGLGAGTKATAGSTGTVNISLATASAQVRFTIAIAPPSAPPPAALPYSFGFVA